MTRGTSLNRGEGVSERKHRGLKERIERGTSLNRGESLSIAGKMKGISLLARAYSRTQVSADG